MVLISTCILLSYSPTYYCYLSLLKKKIILFKHFQLLNRIVLCILIFSKIKMSLIIKTTTNIWEMEKGFDIILFIDKNDVYNRNYWKDECFRRINDKYPFQEL